MKTSLPLILTGILGVTSLQVVTVAQGSTVQVTSKTTTTQSTTSTGSNEIVVTNGLENKRLEAAVKRLTASRSQLRVALPYGLDNSKLSKNKRQTDENVALLAQTVSKNPKLSHLKIDGLLQSKVPLFANNFSHSTLTALTLSFDNSFSSTRIKAQETKDWIKNQLLEGFLKKLPKLRTLHLVGFLDTQTTTQLSFLNLEGKPITITLDGNTTRQTPLKLKALAAKKKTAFATKA